MLKLVIDFAKPGDSIVVVLDSTTVLAVANEQREVWLSRKPGWKVAPEVTPQQKNPSRSGMFKEAFNHNMLFVYATHGTRNENQWAYSKARFDAEVWYYRGNGSVDIIPDDQFTVSKYKDRSVILYGNRETNSAWQKLLTACPVSVTSERIALGKEIFTGKDLGIYFAWPREDSETAMVGVVSGTGLEGMRATDPNQYFAAGSGFPDFLIFSSKMLADGPRGIKAAGFFDNDWSLGGAVIEKD